MHKEVREAFRVHFKWSVPEYDKVVVKRSCSEGVQDKARP